MSLRILKHGIYCIQEVLQRCSTDIPLLDPINDMNIKDPEFDKVIEQIEKFESRLFAHPLHEKDDTDNLYALYLEKDQVCTILY